MLTENCIYVYDLIIFSASIHNIRISKKINGTLPLCELFPLIFLEILMLCIETEKIIKQYTYIQFGRSERGSVFDFRFYF